MILFETKNNFTLRKDFLFLKKKNHLTFIIISKKKKKNFAILWTGSSKNIFI